MRIDQLLVQQGLASSRSQAQRLIAAGVQWRLPGSDEWQRVAKNGDEVPQAAELQLHDAAEARYVSRGGLKLEGALQRLGWSIAGLRCLDVGQSTGGFTDCLLQHGAHSVLGLDVGSGQLHPRLQADARVLALENTNARHLSATDLIAFIAHAASSAGQKGIQNSVSGTAQNFAPPFDVLVMDVSFISQTLVLPAVLPLLRSGGRLLSLVKPQFELQPGQIGKGGIVRDAALYTQVQERVQVCCAELGMHHLAWLESPIAGGDGNREFFIAAQRGDSVPA
ncbi:TlyA family RNA methyltransferase [Curvibacter sp. CHRR-16]|uniref:TlyA family RNA methyltransferase n=1 Tax=Curvibacter sp. CHRR-16 TaxID=2835872 RepID=UPI001BDA7CB7|nr:TlyA family RNA methyltransferase [Curvibacter sp. CHRR-16]MBT0569900.1 TlyA family RNA methyltransferase [Curvibacter sp. CHRR-16]